MIQPFVQFKDSADLKKIHELVGRDMDLTSLQLQFLEICGSEIAESSLTCSVTETIQMILKTNGGMEHYRELIITLARIDACTPHSADTERCISANNLLKTSLRSNLNLETENNYLHVRFNLPTLDKWDPRPSIDSWFQKKERRQNGVSTSKKETIAQKHFHGVFESAGTKDDTDEKADDTFKNFKF